VTTKYEILLMLDPELADERQQEIIGRVRELPMLKRTDVRKKRSSQWPTSIASCSWAT
jgi:hypothetical protein